MLCRQDAGSTFASHQLKFHVRMHARKRKGGCSQTRRRDFEARIATAFVLHWKEVKTHPLKPPIQAFGVENHHGTTSAKPQVMYENQHV